MRKFQNIEGVALQMLKTSGTGKATRTQADQDEESYYREEVKE